MLRESTIISSYYNSSLGEEIKIKFQDNNFYYFNRGDLVLSNENLVEVNKIPVSRNKLTSLEIFHSCFLMGDSQGTFYLIDKLSQ